MPSLFFVAFLAIASLQGTFGAPCANLGSCISKCKAKTGWPNPMSNYTWVPPSSAAPSPASTPAANAQVNPDYGNPSEPASTSAPTTQPVPASTPAAVSPSPSPPASNGSVSSADIQTYLQFHNSVRADHGAAPLTWSNDLSSVAQAWANGCKFQHSGGPNGENLAAGTGSGYGIQQAIQSWTDEVSSYNAQDPQPSHFTQVVWKSTTQVGCAVKDCPGIFPASYGIAHYYVCEYSPPGNVEGEYAQNVQA